MRDSRLARCTTLLLLGTTAALCAACGPSAAERARGSYRASLDGWTVRETPRRLAGPQPAAGPQPEPVIDQLVTLDVVVERLAPAAGEGSTSPLERLTLDITQSGAAGGMRELRQTVALSELDAGGRLEVAVELDGARYEPGDSFAVEVRATVPAEERAAYPELTERH